MEEGLKVSFIGDLDPLRQSFREAANGVKSTAAEINKTIATIGQGVIKPLNIPVTADTSKAQSNLLALEATARGTTVTWQELNKLFHGLFHGKSGDDSLGAKWQQIKAGKMTFEQFIQTLKLTEEQAGKTLTKLKEMGISVKLPTAQEMRIPVSLEPPRQLPPLKSQKLQIESVILPPKLPPVKMPAIVIPIDGNVATKSLRQLEDQLKRFKDGLRDATNPQSLARLNRAIDVTNNRIRDLNRIRDPFKGVQKGTSQASLALMDFSRVAQDAPYGIRGVANNLNPMIESFVRLKQETGSTKNALKAMVAGLAGPAGIGMAVAVVSSLLVTFGDRLFKTADKGEELRKKMNAAKEATENFLLTLSASAGVNLEGTKNAQKELINLNLLYNATQNHNLALSERKKAVDALQEQYPKYFKNIADEIILNGGAKKSYDQLKTAILEASKARAATSKIDELSGKKLDKEAESSRANQEEYDALQLLNRAKKNYYEASKRGDGQVITYLTRMQVAQRKYNEAAAKSAALAKEIFGITDDQNRLLKELGTQVETQGLDIILDPTGKLDQGKLNKDTKEKLDDALQKLEDYVKGLNLKAQADFNAVPRVVDNDGKWLKEFNENLRQQYEKQQAKDLPLPGFDVQLFEAEKKELLSEYKKLFSTLGKSLPKQIDMGGGFMMDIKLLNPEQLKEQLGALFANIKAETEQAAQAISSVLTPAFQGMFNAITQGEQPIKAFFEGIKQSIISLINQLIAAAVQAMVLSALTGGGTSFSKAFGQIMGVKKFAHGGIIKGPTLGLMGEYAGARNNPEVVAPLNKLRSMMGTSGGGNVTVTGRLRGGDIILSNQRTQRKQKGKR